MNALLPRICAHCGLDLHYLEEVPLCPACAAGLEPLPPLHCEACGLPLRDGGGSCRDCRGGAPRSLALARSAFVFNPQLRSLVHSFKYKAREDLAGFLGGKMAAALPGFPELGPYKFTAAVPLHRSRRRDRGFNQAELLASTLAVGSASPPPPSGPFELSVTGAGSRGTLVFTSSGVSFTAADPRKSRQWPYPELKQIRVVSPRKIAFDTFEDGSRWRFGADRTGEGDGTEKTN